MSCWRVEFFTHFSQTNEILIFCGKIGKKFHPSQSDVPFSRLIFWCWINRPMGPFRTFWTSWQPMTVELYDASLLPCSSKARNINFAPNGKARKNKQTWSSVWSKEIFIQNWKFSGKTPSPFKPWVTLRLAKVKQCACVEQFQIF